MTKNKIFLFFLCITTLFLQYVQAQNFGAHPYGLNWQVMESPAGNVIFPNGMEARARRVSNIINYMNDSCLRSVGNTFKKINIVLQNQTVIANGYVGLAPFRSEFYTTPAEGIDILGSIDWIDGLAIHEYRHVLQYRNSNKGFTRFMHLFQGQYGWAAAADLSLPNWYWEGDAVITETALSNSGRGRTPSFFIDQRALAFAGIDYTYMKLRNGSYKNLLPNHYPLGYMMLTFLRNEKGNDVIKDVVSDAVKYKNIVYPFSGALNKYTGYRTPALYKASWEAAKKHWKEELEKTTLTPTIPVTQKNKRTVTNYFFPQFDKNGDVIAMKNSYKETDAIYRISGKGEQKIITIGFNLGNYFNYKNEKIVWTERSQNPRRTNVSYSDIYMYDLESHTKKRLTKKGKYFSPVIAGDGKTIAAVYVDEQQQCTLKSIDLSTGRSIDITTFESDEFVARPSFTGDDKAIVYILQKKNQLAIYKYDISTNTKIQLTPWTAHIIDALHVHGDYVYYTASFSGIDNIYLTPLNGSMKIQQLTSVPIGAYEPSINESGDTLLFKEFTEMGYVISKMAMSNGFSKAGENIILEEPIEMNWLDRTAYKAEGGNILNKIPDKSYEVKPYKGLLKGLTLHSWYNAPTFSKPFLTKPIFTMPSLAKYSLNLYVDNYLNDVSIILGSGYNRNEKTFFYNGALSIGRWYPVITLNTQQSKRVVHYLRADTVLAYQVFNENTFNTTVSLPYHWLKGNYSSNLYVGVGETYHQILHRITSEGHLPNEKFNSLDAAISFSTLKRIARQNVGSRLGVAASISYFRDIENFNNEKIKTLARVYFPGIGANHNLKISYAFQKELLSNSYQYADDFEYPRGYSAAINDETQKLSFDYTFPVAYPDWGFWGITYFKRINANLFYDYGKSKIYIVNYAATYQSVGAELLFNNTVCNVLPLSFGIGETYLLNKYQEKKWVPSFYISSLF